MKYKEFIELNDIIQKLDTIDYKEDGDIAVDAILLIDSYRSAAKHFDTAREKWGKENAEFAEKWDAFVQKNIEKLKTGGSIVVPEELREGKVKLDAFLESLNEKEVEGFEERTVFNSVKEWARISKSAIPSEIRLLKKYNIILEDKVKQEEVEEE